MCHVVSQAAIDNDDSPIAGTVKFWLQARSCTISLVQLVIRQLIDANHPMKIHLWHLDTNISKSTTLVKKSDYLLYKNCKQRF